jgi:hypothetical protein
MDGSDWIRLAVIVFAARVLSRDAAFIWLLFFVAIHCVIFVAELFMKGGEA